MNKISTCFIFIILITPAIAHAYPLGNTEFLKAAYCFHMSHAPRLEVDLSDTEKKEGQQRFFEALLSRNLEFPQGEDYEAIRRKFITWVAPRFRNEPTDSALIWYKGNCLSSDQ
jgi:hypothetical protein